jgi:hypothetical protein
METGDAKALSVVQDIKSAILARGTLLLLIFSRAVALFSRGPGGRFPRAAGFHVGKDFCRGIVFSIGKYMDTDFIPHLQASVQPRHRLVLR